MGKLTRKLAVPDCTNERVVRVVCCACIKKLRGHSNEDPRGNCLRLINADVFVSFGGQAKRVPANSRNPFKDSILRSFRMSD